MIAKLSLGALAVTLVATAAVAAPLRPNMVLPALSVPGQTAPAATVEPQQPAAQEGQGTSGPARPRVRRANSFFGVPLALIAAGAGAGVGAIAASSSTASPQ